MRQNSFTLDNKSKVTFDQLLYLVPTLGQAMGIQE